MGLTSEQQTVKEGILEAIEEGYTRIVLKGSAGVGKTYLVNDLIISLKVRRNQLIYVTAPTHKALSVLREKVTVEGANLEFTTVHAGLKLRRHINKDTGEIYFKQDKNSKKNPPFQDCGVLIIDEASMLNTQLLKHLEDFNFPIIFIGDDKQLNPVKELTSPVFHKNWPTFELKEIIRQGKGNPIIDLSRNLKWIGTKEAQLTEEDAGFLYTWDRKKVIDKLAEVNGTDELKYLAWTNEEVNVMNYSVRHKIYDSPAMIEKGETIILNAPYEDFYTNQEVKIEELGIMTGVYGKVDSTEIRLKTYIINDQLKIVHEDSLKEYRKILARIKQLCIWKELDWKEDYYELMEKFVDFKYNHAITVHKSQGSTYKDTIVNIGNLRKNYNREERQRLLYTAVTRASNLLILYNT